MDKLSPRVVAARGFLRALADSTEDEARLLITYAADDLILALSDAANDIVNFKVPMSPSELLALSEFKTEIRELAETKKIQDIKDLVRKHFKCCPFLLQMIITPVIEYIEDGPPDSPDSAFGHVVSDTDDEDGQSDETASDENGEDGEEVSETEEAEDESPEEDEEENDDISNSLQGSGLKSFISPSLDNRESYTGLPYQCQVCARRYSSKRSLQRHMRSKHKITF